MREISRYFQEGGVVMILIAGISLVGWIVALNAWFRARTLLRLLDNKVPVLRIDKSFVDSRLSELDRKLSLLATMATALPLLGLLGTVLGMLITFEVIEGYGTGQPSLLAGGIRHALLTTQSGLWTALPILLMHEMISGRTRKAAYEANVLFGGME